MPFQHDTTRNNNRWASALDFPDLKQSLVTALSFFFFFFFFLVISHILEENLYYTEITCCYTEIEAGSETGLKVLSILISTDNFS